MRKCSIPISQVRKLKLRMVTRDLFESTQLGVGKAGSLYLDPVLLATPP